MPSCRAQGGTTNQHKHYWMPSILRSRGTALSLLKRGTASDVLSLATCDEGAEG